MRKHIAYAAVLLCALLVAPSCSKEAPGTDAGAGTGTLVMNISATRVEGDDQYDPFDFATICIYNGRDELTRKYASIADLPQSLELLAGDYRITVDAGDNAVASFSHRTYQGEEAFTITAGETEPVQVECLLVNTVVEVRFDKSVTDNFGSEFHAWVMAADLFDQEAAEAKRVPALKYTADAKGYFILPEGATKFACRFQGEHPQRGVVEHSQLIENVQPQGKYVLTYKFSPDLPGFITLESISVDTSEDEEDDTIIFSPDPTLSGVGFDAEEVLRYTSGERSYTIAAIAELRSATITLDGGTESYDLLNGSGNGITLVKHNANSLTLTLSDAFFADRTAGDHTLQFNITDAGNGELNTLATFRLQGLIPIRTGDCNLWQNTLTLRAVSFDAQSGASFGLREVDGQWREQAGTLESPDFYTTTFAPEWTTGVNAHSIPIYTFKANTGVFAGRSYKYRATIAGVETITSLTTSTGDIIPGGDMEGNISCFTNSNSGSTTWGSGNNSMTSGLCTKATSANIGQVGGAQCAKLTASVTAGMLAAGNLFFGTFNFSAPFGPGTVGFGQKYNYTARPSALRVRYHAKVGTVNVTKHEAILPNGTQDISTIFACIIDWDARRNVTSGTSYPSGIWDPEKQTRLDGLGEIIAYGKLNIDQTTPDNSLIPAEIPLNFYNTVAAAPTGRYTLIISCSTSMYGDYMNGCSSNVMYVDDFEWVY